MLNTDLSENRPTKIVPKTVPKIAPKICEVNTN